MSLGHPVKQGAGYDCACGACLSEAAAWVVEFDYRSDNGERHVGPFPTKTEGQAWLARQAFDYEALVAPMEVPS